MTTIKSLLHRHPYPVLRSVREIIGFAALLAGTVYFLLAVFQPFGTYGFYSEYKYLLLAPYAGIAFLVFTAADWMLRKRAAAWGLGQELIKITITLLVCAILSYGYNAQFVSHVKFSWQGIGAMAMFTLALGVPAVTIFLLARYAWVRRSIKTETTAAHSLNSVKLPEPVNCAEEVLPPDTKPIELTRGLEAMSGSPESKITFFPVAGPELTLSANDFLAAESAGNYCHVFYAQQGMLRKVLLRLPLKLLEAQAGSIAIVRCHRSFVVNTAKVIRSKGNAQGGQLYLELLEQPVPVSRRYATLLQNRRISLPSPANDPTGAKSSG